VTTAKPTFVWSKVTASTYYRLWIKNSGGTWVMQSLYYGQNICGATNCAVTPALSLANGTYTWYIQTLTATQNGTWSAHTFTVAIPTPGVSTLVSPKGTIHLAKPTFIWSKDSVATLYRLWIKNNTTSAWVIQNLYAGKNICGVTNCAIVSPVTLANGSYTWYIDTLTNTQNGQWSAQAFVVSVPDEIASHLGDDAAAIK
jgi:predicted RNA-binding protein with TRAM domain